MTEPPVLLESRLDALGMAICNTAREPDAAVFMQAVAARRFHLFSLYAVATAIAVAGVVGGIVWWSGVVSARPAMITSPDPDSNDPWTPRSTDRVLDR